MTLEKDLVGAVLASPEDDGPRLVYADWLLEHGDPRGEFIQIQCALGRPLLSAKGYPLRSHAAAKEPPTREELEKREKELLKKHQKTWIAPIRSWIRTWNWKRGFVDHVVADGAKFVSGAETIFATTPLFHADLTGFKPPALEALAKTAALRALRSLSLSQQRIGPKTAHVLLSPHLCGLEALDISSNPLGTAGVTMLASATHFGALRTLKLDRTDMGLAGLEALTKASFFPRLTRLDLDVGYDPDGAKAFGPAAGELLCRGESLVSLSIGGARIGDEGCEALAASPAMSNLEELMLFSNAITERGALAITRSPHLTRLRALRGIVGYSGGLEEGSAGARVLRERFGDAIM